jgi:hypothetical protein
MNPLDLLDVDSEGFWNVVSAKSAPPLIAGVTIIGATVFLWWIIWKIAKKS